MFIFVFFFFSRERIVERMKADIVAAEMIKAKRVAPIDSCLFLTEKGTFFLSFQVFYVHTQHMSIREKLANNFICVSRVFR